MRLHQVEAQDTYVVQPVPSQKRDTFASCWSDFDWIGLYLTASNYRLDVSLVIGQKVLYSTDDGSSI